jgi:glycosyltransferase involved in cell wall biosynthesis
MQNVAESEVPLKLLSVIIPARDEEACIAATIEHLHLELTLNKMPHEIIAVDDGSGDQTRTIVQQIASKNPTVHAIVNEGSFRFGRAVIRGLDVTVFNEVVNRCESLDRGPECCAGCVSSMLTLLFSGACGKDLVKGCE